MDQRIILGLGVSIAFGFARWRWPNVPKLFATAGFVIGVSLLLWSIMPFIRPGPALLGTVAIVALAVAFEWQFSFPPSEVSAAVSTALPSAQPAKTIVRNEAHLEAAASTKPVPSLGMTELKKVPAAPVSTAFTSNESTIRAEKLKQLTRLYMMSHDGISPRMAAGLELPPIEFLNEELESQGAKWRVRSVAGAVAETYDLH